MVFFDYLYYLNLISSSKRLCHVHNQVNERLGKPEFDCAHLDETYDCGCGDEPVGVTMATPGISDTSRDDMTGVDLIRGG
jgi:FAD-linked sulfhydryl oxidase